jgi:hypothetical protein
LKLYFDSNVYDFIDDTNEVGAIRAWLKKQGHDLCVSDEANLGEMARISDLNRRAHLLGVMTSIGHLCAPPTDMISSKELLGEIARLHPGWLRIYPSLQSERKYIETRRRQMWEPLKEDPSRFSAPAQGQQRTLEKVLGENRDAMRKRRDERPQKAAMYGDLNLVTREQMRMDWELFLFGPANPSAEVDWLRPCLDLNAVAADQASHWRHFWDVEVDVARMPMNYFSAVFVHSLIGANIGDSIDRIHACHLLTSERVVTCDEAFLKVMERARAIQTTPGQPVLIDRAAASVVRELQRQGL